MKKQYQLMDIETNEVTMCEKYTNNGFDYYLNYDDVKKGDWFLKPVKNYIPKRFKPRSPIDSVGIDTLKVIATTNTSLQCPQVVDYVDELANEYLSIRCHKNLNTLDEENLVKEGYIDGYHKHSETHSLSDEEVVMFAKFVVKNRLDMEQFFMPTYDELLQQFKSTLPTKVYYR